MLLCQEHLQQQNLSYPCHFLVDLLCLLTVLVSPAKHVQAGNKVPAAGLIQEATGTGLCLSSL